MDGRDGGQGGGVPRVSVVGVDAPGAEVKVAFEADVALLGGVDHRRHSVGQPADRVGAGESEPDGCREASQFPILASTTRKLRENQSYFNVLCLGMYDD